MTEDKEGKLQLKDISIACEYLDIFQKELPGIPSVRKVEFSNDLAPSTCDGPCRA